MMDYLDLKDQDQVNLASQKLHKLCTDYNQHHKKELLQKLYLLIDESINVNVTNDNDTLKHLQSINTLVQNLNNGQGYLNGIYRCHLLETLTRSHNLYLSQKITPLFAGYLSLCLLVTNISLIPKRQTMLTVRLFHSMYEKSDHFES